MPCTCSVTQFLTFPFKISVRETRGYFHSHIKIRKLRLKDFTELGILTFSQTFVGNIFVIFSVGKSVRNVKQWTSSTYLEQTWLFIGYMVITLGR